MILRPWACDDYDQHVNMSKFQGNKTNLGVPLESVEQILQFVLWIHHLQNLIVAATFHKERKPTETPCLLCARLTPGDQAQRSAFGCLNAEKLKKMRVT